jgi:hypothetical protein
MRNPIAMPPCLAPEDGFIVRSDEFAIVARPSTTPTVADMSSTRNTPDFKGFSTSGLAALQTIPAGGHLFDPWLVPRWVARMGW